MLEKKIKKLGVWDIGLIKLTAILATLTIISFYPGFALWILSINPWYLLAATLIVAAFPVYKVWFK